MVKKAVSLAMVIVALSATVEAGLKFGGMLYNGEYGVDGLSGAYYVMIGPEGKQVYIVAYSSIGWFDRSSSSGILSYKGCIKDGRGPSEAPELLGAHSAAISRDGKQVYVAASQDNAVSWFDRDAASGALTYRDCYKNGEKGIIGLGGANSIVITHDGKYIYVSAGADNSVTWFGRNPDTGSLVHKGSIKQDPNGVYCLSGANCITLSPDEKQVYIASAGDNAVSWFNRDTATGGLTHISSINNGRNGVTFTCFVAASPDGRNVYAVANLGNAVSWFDRDLSTGALTYKDFLQIGPVHLNNVKGFALFASVIVGRDGKHVYAVSPNDNVLHFFDRDSSAGALTYKESYKGGENISADFNGSTSIAFSPDDKQAYVALYAGLGVSRFDRDSSTGALIFKDILKQGQYAIVGLGGAAAVTISHDGKYAYCAAVDDKAISWFARDSATGALTWKGHLQNGQNGIEGIEDVRAVAISPDGASLYTGGGRTDFTIAHQIHWFDLNVSTGEPSYRGFLKRADNVYIWSIAVSPDGKHVYVPSSAQYYTSGHDQGMISVYARDSATGTLTLKDSIKIGDNGIYGWDGARCAMISPDGKQVYIAANTDNSISWFDRDRASGALAYKGCFQNNADSLFDPIWITISPDGRHVYAVSNLADALHWFDRESSSGTLTHKKTIINSINGVDGLHYPKAIAVSPDGTQAYVINGDALSWYSRDAATGALAYKGCFRQWSQLNGCTSVIVSPDSRHVYVASSALNAVSWFIVIDETTHITSDRMTTAPHRPWSLACVNNSLSFTLPYHTSSFSLRLTDFKGRIVFSIAGNDLTAGPHSLPLTKSNIPAGGYIGDVATDRARFVHSVVILR